MRIALLFHVSMDGIVDSRFGNAIGYEILNKGELKE